jgi:HAD superfamily phosphatase (TIGR01668 family)
MNRDCIPDVLVPGYAAVTARWLLARGKRGLVADLDNTLARYGDAEPPEAVLAWARSLREGGIRLAVASNNNENRVGRFCRILGVPYAAKAKKPRPQGVLHALQLLGLEPEAAAMLGDQVFSDVKAANRAGLLSLLAPPLNTHSLFFRIRYQIEKPYRQSAGETMEDEPV